MNASVGLCISTHETSSFQNSAQMIRAWYAGPVSASIVFFAGADFVGKNVPVKGPDGCPACMIGLAMNGAGMRAISPWRPGCLPEPLIHRALAERQQICRN